MEKFKNLWMLISAVVFIIAMWALVPTRILVEPTPSGWFRLVNNGSLSAYWVDYACAIRGLGGNSLTANTQIVGTLGAHEKVTVQCDHPPLFARPNQSAYAELLVRSANAVRSSTTRRWCFTRLEEGPGLTTGGWVQTDCIPELVTFQY